MLLLREQLQNINSSSFVITLQIREFKKIHSDFGYTRESRIAKAAALQMLIYGGGGGAAAVATAVAGVPIISVLERG